MDATHNIIYTSLPAEAAAKLVAEISPDRVVLLFDEETARLFADDFKSVAPGLPTLQIVIGRGDAHKHLDTLAAVWQQLSTGGMTRHSLLLCIGGGMVTDLGGFAAATFKRGIRFVNVPTTLLAMVDAAVGGKTGINFNGLKNEIGAFAESRAVVISTELLRTLDSENLLSGYAEMIKHALLSSEEMLARHLNFSWQEPDFQELQEMVRESVSLKQRIVTEDPREQGIRKALNLGHTFGHAFESFALATPTPLLHGHAVALGLICELWLSAALAGFPTERMRQTVRYIRDHYAPLPFSCNDYERLYALMRHDKKNAGDHINFTLLESVGNCRIDCHIEKDLIFEAFDFLREG